MTVTCPGCGRAIEVPPDKAALPNLKVKCRCGAVFAAAERTAAPPLHAPAPAPAAAPRPPAAPTAVVAGAIASATALPKIQRPPLPATGTPAAAGAVRPPAPAPPVARPVAAAAPASPGVAVAPAAPGAAAAPAAAPVEVNWRRCVNHRQARTDFFCPACQAGYCEACTQKVQTAFLCPKCEGLCISAAKHAEALERARRRERMLMEDLPLIASYPLVDPIAYVMLAVFTWFFGLFTGFGFGGIMYVLSKGVLTWYSFNAVSKVSIGNMRQVMPEFRDLSDITNALRLSFVATLAGAGPLFLCVFLIPGLSFSSRVTLDEGPGPATFLLVALLGLWALAYIPVALIVAALSKSWVSTLNPMIGIDTIKKMGNTYWEALAIYLGIAVAAAAVSFVLAFIPFLGGFVRGFVEAYVALAVGCTLGLAVFKKAEELGWD